MCAPADAIPNVPAAVAFIESKTGWDVGDIIRTARTLYHDWYDDLYVDAPAESCPDFGDWSRVQDEEMQKLCKK